MNSVPRDISGKTGILLLRDRSMHPCAARLHALSHDAELPTHVPRTPAHEQLCATSRASGAQLHTFSLTLWR